jgi:Prp8 binding protein
VRVPRARARAAARPHAATLLSTPTNYTPRSALPRLAALWDYRGGCANTLSLRGHKNAVLRVAWLAAGAGQLATASADRTCAVWDAPSGARLRTLTGHERIVNDVAAGAAREAGSHALASASDDGSVLLWDARARRAAGAVPGRAPLLACAYGADAHTLYCAGVEGVVRAYDLRGGSSSGSGSGSGSGGQLLPVLTLEDGGGGVSSLAASPNGFQLLALGFDGVARTYDVQAFCAAPSRCTGALGAARAPGAGAGAGAGGLFDSGLLRASWSPCGQRVCVGGSDKVARVYEAASGQLLAELPGHTGAVVEGAWHPEEPVLATAGDRTVFIGELSR